MPDYNLSGLSTRSFEQLVQAIAAKVLGPSIVIFGDGRDGGREATFEGTITYAPRGEQWSGYGVIQAKFKQRPENTQSDGDWAVQQLRGEFEDFLDPKKARRKPEYYIFTTNLVLTPFMQKGSKDRINGLFKEYSDRLPFKDYDVWDYDKLRVYLDDNEEIRRAYAAWITSGDVLAQVMEWLKPTRPDFEKTISRFLQEELLADQYANLEQAGHASDDRIPIARVFIDLPTFDKYLVEPPEEDEKNLYSGFIHELLNIASARLDAQSNIRAQGSSVRQEHEEPEPGRLALIGGPGQGKTTMGQYVCQLFRASILNDRPAWSILPEADKALKTIKIQCEEEAIHLPSARRFPVRIVLNQFAKVLAQENGPITSLLLYIVDQIKKRTDQEISPDDFRKWLESYPWLLVLDGLDEVPASSNREQVLNALRSFRMEVGAANGDLLILATTRPQGYSLEFGPARFRHTYLAPLSAKRALYYAKRLVSVRHSKDQDRKEKILSRLDRASHQPATVRLMRSPLQVTIMATLVDRMGQPPQERWNLFKEYYNVIYQREVERDIPAAAILREHKADVDTIHKHAGLLLQVESESRGTTDARLSEDRFAAIVETRLADMGHDAVARELLKKRIIEAATHRLVFLVGLEADEIGFEIRSLQEYMAAEGLMAGSDLQVRDRLKQIAANANWRNVFLFATGKCFAEREDLLDTIYTLCMNLNDDPADDLSRTSLAGSQLALDILEDTPIRQQPKNARTLARIALRILDLPPQPDHIRFAGIYDPALESVYREELLIRLNQMSFEDRLGAFGCLIGLIEAGVPWAEGLGNESWPVKLDEEKELLKIKSNLEESHSIESSWIQLKLTDIVPRHEPNLFFEYFLDRPSKEERVTWLAVAKEMLSLNFDDRSFVFVPLLPEVTRAQSATFRIRSVSETNDWLRPIKDMPRPSKGWQPAVCGARLLDKPSKKSLAAGLRTLAVADDPVARKWWDVEVPWPLSSCSAAAEDSNALLTFADRADSGYYGNPADWLAAERRWRKQGVTKDDIMYAAAEDHWPFDQNIATHGFPFSATFLSFNPTDPLTAINAFLQIYDELQPSKMKNEVGKWVLALLSQFADSIQVPPVTFEQFRQFLNIPKSIRFSYNLAILARLRWERELSDEWALFFDELGRNDASDLTYTPKIKQQVNHLAELISEAFARIPKLIGLLRLLSLLARNGASFTISPELLNPDKYVNDVDKLAAIQIKILTGSFIRGEAKKLAKIVAEICKRDELSRSRIRITPEMAHGEGLEFLLALLQKLSASQWELESHIIANFNISLRTRNSQLNIPEVWASVKLPMGLTSLLPKPM